MVPQTIADVEELELLLSEPPPGVIDALAGIEGDLLVLGVAGKMGPTLARMALRASQESGRPRRVIGVSRFSDPSVQNQLEQWGMETIQGDLLDPDFVSQLPDAPNVVYMAGMKFGATGNEPLTWAMNTYLPSVVCSKFRASRLVAFSTGNVYGLVPVDGGGSVEGDAPNPVGEYAMSCLGRERMFEYFSERFSIPTALIRLNYATELRYGVLVDIARKVQAGESIDLGMGYVNVIWQGDANAMALAALADTTIPPFFLNVAGPERLHVREVAERFGRGMGRQPVFAGTESENALLSNSEKAHRRYGPPRIDVDQMINWIADWLQRGGALLGKPTHFESRSGKF